MINHRGYVSTFFVPNSVADRPRQGQVQGPIAPGEREGPRVGRGRGRLRVRALMNANHDPAAGLLVEPLFSRPASL